ELSSFAMRLRSHRVASTTLKITRSVNTTAAQTPSVAFARGAAGAELARGGFAPVEPSISPAIGLWARSFSPSPGSPPRGGSGSPGTAAQYQHAPAQARAKPYLAARCANGQRRVPKS